MAGDPLAIYRTCDLVVKLRILCRQCQALYGAWTDIGDERVMENIERRTHARRTLSNMQRNCPKLLCSVRTDSLQRESVHQPYSFELLLLLLLLLCVCYLHKESTIRSCAVVSAYDCHAHVPISTICAMR